MVVVRPRPVLQPRYVAGLDGGFAVSAPRRRSRGRSSRLERFTGIVSGRADRQWEGRSAAHFAFEIVHADHYVLRWQRTRWWPAGSKLLEADFEAARG